MDERTRSESRTAPAQELTSPAAAVAAPLSPAAAHDVGCACAGCSPAWSPANVLALQRGAGNAAVARSIAPHNVLARVIDDRAYNEGRQARDTWIAGGTRGPIDHVPSTGRGGFSVSYDPAAQELVIELRADRLGRPRLRAARRHAAGARRRDDHRRRHRRLDVRRRRPHGRAAARGRARRPRAGRGRARPRGPARRCDGPRPGHVSRLPVIAGLVLLLSAGTEQHSRKDRPYA